MNRLSIKKAAVLLLLSSALLIFGGCAPKEISMSVGKPTSAEETLEITPENVLVTPQVYAPFTSGGSMGYIADSGKTYVVVCARVKNISDKEVDLQKACDFRLGEDEKEPLGTKRMIAAPDETESTLDFMVSVKAGESRDVYFITETEAKAVGGEIPVFFDVLAEGESERAYNYRFTADTSQPVAVYKELKLKEKIKIDDFAEVTLHKVSLKTKIEPENPGYFYSYYKAGKKGNRLLCMEVEVKNLSGSKKEASAFYGMHAETADGLSYIGEIAADDKAKANITASEEIESGKTRKTYAVCDLPKGSQQGDMQMYLYLNGEYYCYTMKSK